MASKHSKGLGRPAWAVMEVGVMMTNLPDCESGFLGLFSILASLTLRMTRGDLEDSDFMAGDLGLDDGGEDVMLLLGFEEGMKSSNGIICVLPVGGLVAFH